MSALAALHQLRITPQLWVYIQLGLMLLVSLRKFYENAKNTLFKAFPSSVTKISYMNIDTDEVETVRLDQIENFLKSHEDIDDQLFFIIKIWSQDVCAYKEYCMNGFHLKKAMHVVNLVCLSYLSESFIVKQLIEYHKNMETIVKSRKVFEITYNKSSMTSALKTFEESLYMDDNLTAKALVMLFFYISSEEAQKYYNTSYCLTITDFDFEEKTLSFEEKLFPKSTNLKN